MSDFGPQLLAKVLRANETQESSLALVFHYADSKGPPLLDLADLRALLTFVSSKEGKAELDGIGGLSKATVGVLLRALVGLETGGGTEFFGEPQLAIADIMRTAADGRGIVSCLELPAVQDRPELFSTVMMWLVAELFEQLPEAGDLEQPKLVFFLDEAHLLFADASDATDAFVESVTRTVSEKGVPTPVVHTRMLAPASKIAPIADVDGAAKASPLFAKYGTRTDAQSARELLAARMEQAAEPEPAPNAPAPPREPRRAPAPAGAADKLGEFFGSRQGKALQRQVMRGVFGMLRKRL